ncbi:hypothetical protein BMI89_18860 [Thioclava sp. F36-7]|nr:hypothetical protein BMI89_18860 [Thioclava sp. F36-7]
MISLAKPPFDHAAAFGTLGSKRPCGVAASLSWDPPGRIDALGPELPFIIDAFAAMQLHQISHTCIAQHLRMGKVCSADEAPIGSHKELKRQWRCNSA